MKEWIKHVRQNIENKLSPNRDSMRHAKPIDGVPPADANISSRVVLPGEILSAGKPNDYDNQTKVDRQGRTFHSLESAKFPREQQIVARLLKGFVNVSDVLELSPDEFFSYEPGQADVPRHPERDERMEADAVLLAKLFRDTDRWIKSEPGVTDGPHNVVVDPTRDHIAYDFHRVSDFLATSMREGGHYTPYTFIPRFEKSSPRVLSILLDKATALKKHYESPEGIEQMKAIFKDVRIKKETNRLLDVSLGKGDPVAEFHAEFMSRLAFIMEETQQRLAQTP